jgi:hypothetical protein
VEELSHTRRSSRKLLLCGSDAEVAIHGGADRRDLNRPGFVGSSFVWRRGSHGTTEQGFSGGEGASGGAGAGAAGRALRVLPRRSSTADRGDGGVHRRPPRRRRRRGDLRAVADRSVDRYPGVLRHRARPCSRRFLPPSLSSSSPPFSRSRRAPDPAPPPTRLVDAGFCASETPRHRRRGRRGQSNEQAHGF